MNFDLSYNKNNRRRTITFILDRLSLSGKLKQRSVGHTCSKSCCSPTNILSFLNFTQATYYNYDLDVYVCEKQKVHICYPKAKCAYSSETRDGKLRCPITGECRERMISSITIPNSSGDITCSRFSSVPQNTIVADRHKTTKKFKNFSLQLDNLYNTEEFWASSSSSSKEKDGAKIRQRRKITARVIKRRDELGSGVGMGLSPCSWGDDDEAFLKRVLRMRMPIWSPPPSDSANKAGLRIFLRSHRLFVSSVYKLNDLKRDSVLEYIDQFQSRGPLIKALGVLDKILPGVYRLRENRLLIESIQKKAYLEGINYIEWCKKNKQLVNSFTLLRLLDFDRRWGMRHNLADWVTQEKLKYFLEIIRRTYILCEQCGFIKDGVRTSMGIVYHTLGVMYTLQKGYSKVLNLECTGGGSVSVVVDIIPQHMYLMKYGVLLDKSKLSTYVGKTARKWASDGEECFKRVLDFGFKVWSDVDLRSLIFSGSVYKD
jgi:hypothetical protein